MDSAVDIDVDPGNTAMARAWGGTDGRHWARYADAYETALRAYDDDLWRAAGVQPNDRVLDVGCGTGSTTRQAARLASSGAVLGVDLSAPMLAVARARAEEAGLSPSFRQGDAQTYPFPSADFDVVVSRTGAMFFADLPAALANLARSLRPGGRLVLLTWQPPQENEWISSFLTALSAGRDLPAPPADQPGPFALSDPERLRRLVVGAGFRPPTVRGLHRPMFFGRDVAEASEMVVGQLGWLLSGLDDEARGRAVSALHHDLDEHRTPEGIRYSSATWLTTATRAAT